MKTGTRISLTVVAVSLALFVAFAAYGRRKEAADDPTDSTESQWEYLIVSGRIQSIFRPQAMKIIRVCGNSRRTAHSPVNISRSNATSISSARGGGGERPRTSERPGLFLQAAEREQMTGAAPLDHARALRPAGQNY